MFADSELWKGNYTKPGTRFPSWISSEPAHCLFPHSCFTPSTVTPQQLVHLFMLRRSNIVSRCTFCSQTLLSEKHGPWAHHGDAAHGAETASIWSKDTAVKWSAERGKEGVGRQRGKRERESGRGRRGRRSAQGRKRDGECETDRQRKRG
ncbi:unnamed protein product [Pleuronectes platessa]|uniref:Uncharacterized protein n=1 Tax=Pleuronectes platessa TaxID=8262 RepID=A0A9N7V099_PLEPL|nr:unnamed protein product [Pleuronectes platessa]